MAPGLLTAERVHTLHPGDVVSAGRGERLETLLGSCVAILLTDPHRTVGAMCHVVHSRPATRGMPDSTAYGDTAMMRMYTLLRSRGIEPRLCLAWVYGGGNMFPQLVGAEARQGNVGAANALWALETLAACGIRVLEHELGGNSYRKIGWSVGTGAPQVTAVPV